MFTSCECFSTWKSDQEESPELSGASGQSSGNTWSVHMWTLSGGLCQSILCFLGQTQSRCSVNIVDWMMNKWAAYVKWANWTPERHGLPRGTPISWFSGAGTSSPNRYPKKSVESKSCITVVQPTGLGPWEVHAQYVRTTICHNLLIHRLRREKKACPL